MDRDKPEGWALERISRRKALKRVAAGAAVAWSAPVLTTVATPALAQQYAACQPTRAFCQPPDPRCDVTGCPPQSPACACGDIGGGNCFCWNFAACTSPTPICQTDADCAAGQRCGDVQSCADPFCAGRKACFNPCASSGAPPAGEGVTVVYATGQ